MNRSLIPASLNYNWSLPLPSDPLSYLETMLDKLYIAPQTLRLVGAWAIEKCIVARLFRKVSIVRPVR
jgi:hypothetical protein